MAINPKASREFDKAFASILGVKKKLFCPPLKLSTEKATRGKEVHWGRTKVLLKDKLGATYFIKTVATDQLGPCLLAAYAHGIKLYKKQAQLEKENAKK